MIKKCKICGKDFVSYPCRINKKFCSPQCFGISKRGRKLTKKWKNNIGKSVKGKNTKTKIQKICKFCKKIFYCIPSMVKKKFCSFECKINSQKGKTTSDHHKEIVRKKWLSSKNPRWKGGQYKTQFGYILILEPNHPNLNHPDGYVFEHRLIMEKSLHRYLEPQEVVHHINGIKDDNRIENLMLFNSKNEHVKFHHLSDKK